MSNTRTLAPPRNRMRRLAFVATIIVAAIVPFAHGQVGSDAPAEAASSGFVETFDTPASLNRFDYAVHHAWIANDTKPGWHGDHDLNCGPPDQTRVIENPTRIDGKTYYPGMGPNAGVVYWCREHMMTAFNSNHYAQIDVSPKQVFEGVSRICWDQNRTDVGARMWTQVVIVPLDTFNANNGRFDYVARRLSKSGPGAFGIHPTDETFMMEVTDGGTYAQTGQSVDTDSSGNWVTNDKATRYQVCLRDNNNGTVRVELENNSGVQVRTVRGAIPDGPSRVIFQHDLYNPDKDSGVANGYTWHWDNIIIETDGWTAPRQPQPPVTLPPSNSDEYRAFSPQRIFDSRAATPNVQAHATGARLAAGSATAIPVAGRFGVAPDAKAVVANITAVDATRAGHIVAGACGSKPDVSTVNFNAADSRANQATVPLDSQGRMCLWTIAPTHVVVDISGFYPRSSGYNPIAGLRYLDTRTRTNTFDGSGAVGRVGAGRQIEVQVAGRGPIPASAAAAAINLTAVTPSGPGHALVFPCGTTRPTASNLNYVAGRDIASGGIVSIGQDGKVCLYVHEETHVVLDVSGWMPGSTFDRLIPARIADTRPGRTTVDGKVAGAGVVRGGSTLRIPLNGRGGVPSTASAVAVHLTIAGPTADGHASAYPCAQPSPGTSTVNYKAGETVTNGAIIRAGGDICVRSHSTAHVIVDVEGFFPN